MKTYGTTRTNIVLCVVALLWNVGCEDAASLSGRVTYDGKPVTRGVISVAPASGKGKGEGAKILNGEYRIDRLEPGQKRVTIVGLTGGEVAAPGQVLSSDDFAKGRARKQQQTGDVVEIPTNADGNGQTMDVKTGAQTRDFALTPPAKQS